MFEKHLAVVDENLSNMTEMSSSNHLWLMKISFSKIK